MIIKVSTIFFFLNKKVSNSLEFAFCYTLSEIRALCPHYSYNDGLVKKKKKLYITNGHGHFYRQLNRLYSLGQCRP